MRRELAELSYTELEALDKTNACVILPVGATEAHGPHLPLSTDVIIAGGMARAGADALAERGVLALVAPALAYTSAGYAAGFAGTVSIRPETATELLVDVCRAFFGHGFPLVALANAHLEPGHIASLEAAVTRLAAEGRVVFPDVTRKPWALRLTDEFKSGACHAGQYEGSVVRAERPELFRAEIAAELPENPASLSRAIRQGKTSFEAAGGPRAYFGAPARATAEEGRETVGVLGAILCEAVLAALGR